MRGYIINVEDTAVNGLKGGDFYVPTTAAFRFRDSSSASFAGFRDNILANAISPEPTRGKNEGFSVRGFKGGRRVSTLRRKATFISGIGGVSNFCARICSTKKAMRRAAFFGLISMRC